MPDREARDHAAVGVPGVHVLARRVHDLGLEVAVDVADRGRAQDLARRRRPARTPARPRARWRRSACCTGWPPLKLASGVPSASSTLSSPLESASTTSSALSPFRSYSRCDASPPVPVLLRPARVQRGVAVGEQHLAVLAAVPGRVGDHHAHRERRLVRVRVARALRRRGGIGGGAAAGARRRARRARAQVDRAERARRRRRSALCGGHVLEVAPRPARCPGAHWSFHV